MQIKYKEASAHPLFLGGSDSFFDCSRFAVRFEVLSCSSIVRFLLDSDTDGRRCADVCCPVDDLCVPEVVPPEDDLRVPEVVPPEDDLPVLAPVAGGLPAVVLVEAVVLLGCDGFCAAGVEGVRLADSDVRLIGPAFSECFGV